MNEANSNPETMKIEKEHYAQNAINQFVQYSCAFLVPGPEGRIAAEVGSGIIIRTRGGHYCVLTAKHIAEDARNKQYRLGLLGCSNPIPDFVAGILLFPYDVDVALLIVKDELASPLKNLAITQDSVPTNGQEEIMGEDSLVLIGYPARISRYFEHKSQQGFISITYWCVPAGISFDKNGRYQLEWKDATVWRGNGTFDLPAPEGMSGGPLWKELWGQT